MSCDRTSPAHRLTMPTADVWAVELRTGVYRGLQRGPRASERAGPVDGPESLDTAR
jgi:hypothetical protein